MRDKKVLHIGEMTEDSRDDFLDQPAINMIATYPEFYLYSKKKWALALGFIYPPDLCMRIISNIGRIPFSIKFHFNPQYWALLPMLLQPSDSASAGFAFRFYWLGLCIERPAVQPQEFCCDNVYDKLKSNKQNVVDEITFVIGF